MIPWVIVGGGLHGVHLAARLIGERQADAEQLLILDPEPKLLHAWKRTTARTGMTHLRSPAVHHLDLDAMSLLCFGGKRRRFRGPGNFAPPYNRPALSFFNAHCDQVVEKYSLAARHSCAAATRIRVEPDRVHITTSEGKQLEAGRLVLALGSGSTPRWPDGVPRSSPQVRHLFQRHFDSWHARDKEVVVLGGGITLEQGEQIHSHEVVLATGWDAARPGGALVDDLVRAAQLPCAPCGYPIVDQHLRWHPRIFVSGALAELMLGPVARNIAGARRAGDCLVARMQHEARSLKRAS